MQLAIEHGLVTEHSTVFDYGCGRGDDVRRLNYKGIDAVGWDPLHSPGSKRRPSDVVNLGYVINVIEDPIERARVLSDAWALTQKVLIVSARLSIEADRQFRASPYSDGCITSRGTFQKYYDQRELSGWINANLKIESVAAGPGIFFVFRNEELRQSFNAGRFRRRVAVPHQRFADRIYEENRDLLTTLASFISTRGRVPAPFELDLYDLIKEKVGNVKRAFAIIQRVTGAEQWAKIREERSDDLLIYLALSRFSRRPSFSQLAQELQLDIRAFFGNYRQACESADKLLFSAGKSEVISEACRKSPVGKRLPDALYLHVSALSALPPVLRIYEGCARAYIGAVENANIIKLKISKPQISYLYYPEFEKTAHPELAASLIVPLDTFHVRYSEYFESPNPFILHRKETFLGHDHPLRKRFERLTNEEEKYKLYENSESIGTRDGWQKVLKSKNLTLSGHRLVKSMSKFVDG